MSPQKSNCPDSQLLAMLAQGELSDGTIAEFETHLQGCSECGEAFDAMVSDSDTCIQLLSQLPPSEDDTGELRQLYSNLYAHPESFGTAGQDSNGIGVGGPVIDLPFRVAEYELVELLGRGAHGSVFKARHCKLDRFVALKLLHRPADNAGRIGEFLDEMRAIGRLDHPNIIRATDAGESGDWFYLVMEFLTGLDVSSVLRRTKRLRAADACAIVHQTALALECIEQHGFVHRDVKPSNLFLTGAGQVKLLDLGLVSFNDDPSVEDQRDHAVARGTADYMSPEQWENYDAVDIRGDIYSLGCTFYKLVTGNAPFHSSLAKRSAHAANQPRPVTELNPEVSEEVAGIMHRMMAKRCEDRYRSPSDLARALKPYADGAELGALVSDRSEASSGSKASSPRGPRRRRILSRRRALGAAAGLLCASWFGWPRGSDASPALRCDNWRQLTPCLPHNLMQIGNEPSEFAWDPSGNAALFEASTRPLSLLNLGQPIQGKFTLQVQLRDTAPTTKCGLFFGFRTRDVNEANLHEFQSIEVDPTQGSTQLVWSAISVQRRSGTLKILARELLADITMPGQSVVNRPKLTVMLGTHGFPNVSWDGERLDRSRWQMSFNGRRRCSIPQRMLEREYRGHLGLLARSGTVQFENPCLKYAS